MNAALIALAIAIPHSQSEEVTFSCSSGFRVRAAMVTPVDGGYALEYFDGLGVVHEAQPGETCTWKVVGERQ